MTCWQCCNVYRIWLGLTWSTNASLLALAVHWPNDKMVCGCASRIGYSLWWNMWVVEISCSKSNERASLMSSGHGSMPPKLRWRWCFFIVTASFTGCVELLPDVIACGIACDWSGVELLSVVIACGIACDWSVWGPPPPSVVGGCKVCRDTRG